MFAKANSGKIKFSDGTGINPKTGKYFDDKDEAIEYYKTLKDQKQKDNFRKWLKGKKRRRNHLK